MRCRRSQESDSAKQLSSEVHQGSACADACKLCEQPGRIKYNHPKTWRDQHAFQLLKTLEPESTSSQKVTFANFAETMLPNLFRTQTMYPGGERYLKISSGVV